MPSPQGRYFLDARDLWTVYSVFVEKGTDGFLNYPERKESTEYDWGDANGVDIDLSAVFFKSRTVVLNCAMVLEGATAETEFWGRYNAFIAQWAQPGKRRFTIARLDNQSFFVIYKKCDLWTMYTPIKGSTKVACKFNITLQEPEPVLNNKHRFIVSHDGKFLIC